MESSLTSHSAPMTRGGSLSSYDSLTPSDGVLAKSLVRVSKDEVLDMMAGGAEMQKMIGELEGTTI